jgi:hypothetical membrane protein
MSNINIQKLLAVCGIIGPIIYTIVVIILATLRPGYSHITQMMSELGAAGAPNALIMNTAGFILLGVLITGFSVGLHRGTAGGKGSKIGPLLIAISGIFLIATGIFPCDPGCVNGSFTGRMHSMSARASGVAMALAPFAIACRFSKDSRWKGYTSYTVASGVVTAFLGLSLLFLAIEGWAGLLQRIGMGVPLFWVEVVAIRLLRLS